jgi:hypothetical protein
MIVVGPGHHSRLSGAFVWKWPVIAGASSSQAALCACRRNTWGSALMASSRIRLIAGLRKAFRRSQRQHAKLIKSGAESLRAATSVHGSRIVTNQERVALNAFLFISLHSHDLAVFAEDFVGARLDARKRVYARVIAVRCLAFFEQITSLVRDTVRADAALHATVEGNALFAAAAGLRPIRRKYEKVLRTIRNTSIAHLDVDAIKQWETISAVEVGKIAELLSAMYKWNAELTKAFLPLLARMHGRLVALNRARAAAK